MSNPRYIEEPDPEISCQSAEMRRRSSDLVRYAGWPGLFMKPSAASDEGS